MKPTFSLLIFLSILSFTACKSPQKAETSIPAGFEGQWEIVVKDTPAGDVPAQITITKEGTAYKGTIATNGSSVDLKGVSVENNRLNGSFYSTDYGQDVYFYLSLEEADSNRLKGAAMNSFPIEGKRKM